MCPTPLINFLILVFIMLNIWFTELSSGHYVFTGSPLKTYLKRHSMSYAQAARELQINKNTVGKTVRGGNINIAVLLRICNFYGLSIGSFFVETTGEDRLDEKGGSDTIQNQCDKRDSDTKSELASEVYSEQVKEMFEKLDSLETAITDLRALCANILQGQY